MQRHLTACAKCGVEINHSFGGDTCYRCRAAGNNRRRSAASRSRANWARFCWARRQKMLPGYDSIVMPIIGRELICPVCGSAFVPSSRHRAIRFCSKLCLHAWTHCFTASPKGMPQLRFDDTLRAVHAAILVLQVEINRARGKRAITL